MLGFLNVADAHLKHDETGLICKITPQVCSPAELVWCKCVAAASKCVVVCRSVAACGCVDDIV